MFQQREQFVGNNIEKLKVYGWALDGSFELRDNNRLKPLTRLRSTFEELEKEQQNDYDLRVTDWYNDIDRGF